MNQDSRYITAVLEGNKEAFRYFIKEYQQLVFSVVISMVKNSHDAEEVVQNTFIQAYKGLRSFKNTSKFSSWLYRIAVNESLKHLRKQKKHKLNEPINISTTNLGQTFNTAVSNLISADIKTAIDQVILALKPKEALVLQLHYLQELSIKEVSETTGFSISNIKVLLHRARKNFMQLYINKG